MYLLQLIIPIILMIQVSGNVLDTVSGIRLVGGSGPFEGRLELKVAGIWGTVCDTNFDMDDAEVLCRMLNLKATTYKHGAYHGEGPGPVYVDNLRCNGHESDVSDCQYDSGSTCFHSNDVSLICTECGDIRVGNGNLSISSDGRTLQISCDDEPVANLGTSNCRQDGTWSQPAVYCTHKEYPLPFTGHRLEYGAGLYDGRVELLLNGTWGTICGNGFREIEAVAICNMFNLTYDRHYPGDFSNAYYYRTGSGPVYIDNLYCTGTENNINQCIYDVVNVCDRYEYPVAVVCKEEQMNITEIRLVDGTSPHEGRAELFWNGVWGTVSDGLYSNVVEDDARFLCAMLNLNYTHHYDMPVFGYADEPILIGTFQCDLSAEFISSNDCIITAPYRYRSDRNRPLSLICTICPEPNITNGIVTSSNGSDIVVTCNAGFVPRQVTLRCDSGVAWVQEEWCTRYEQPNITSVRVSGTNGPYHGVVDVEINGTWASVCYDNLVSFTFAHVICQELGARSYRTYTASVPETSDGAVYVKRLTCSSSNDPINNCYFDTDSTCNRNFFIYCYGPSLDISDVRLVNGTSDRSGRAEIKVGDTWGTICDTYFGIDDANAFCKMLDLKAVQYFPGSKYGAGTGPVLVDSYYCYSFTTDLSHCNYLYLNECDSGSIISVICNECGETELSHWDVSFFTYSGDKTYADCSYYNTYVGTLELTCDNVTQNWVTNGECQEYSYPINVMDIRLADGNPRSSGRVELKTMGYWGTICGDSFGQNEANMICAMVGYWPAVAFYTNAFHGEGSGPIFVDDLRCGQNASDLNNCSYVTDDDCTHSEDVSVVCTDCGDPTPSNGFSNTSRTNYRTVTQIACSTGYICEGSSTITCLLNGSWSDQPKCKLIDCGDPTPEYGSVNTTATTNGTVVLVSCDTGYQRSGSETIFCQINDTWTEYPSCNIKDCGIPSPPNADVELSNNMTTYGAMATITCITGYLPTGSIIVSCLPNGSWDVWPTCEVVDCGDPVPYKGFADSTDTLYGSIVEIGCEAGLNMSGNSTIQCLEDGIWSDTPVCDVSDCGIPQIANGFVDVNETNIGSSANVDCNAGYDLSGPSTIQCSTSGWNDSFLECVIQECDDPTPLNGTLNENKGFKYGDTAQVTCLEGFDIEGDSTITCEDGGVWSSNTVCVLKDCGQLNQPENGFIDNEAGTKYQAKVRFSCQVGYLLVGEHELFCDSDGEWNGDDPVCQRLSDVGEFCTEDIFCRSDDAVCVQNSCQCKTGIYDERTDKCDTMPLFPFGENKDAKLQSNRICTTIINSKLGILVLGKLSKGLCVCRHGIVSLDKPFKQSTPPVKGRVVKRGTVKAKIIAPLSAEFDPKKGNVYYRAYDLLSYDKMLAHKNEIEYIKGIVIKFSSVKTFEASFVLVATWENVQPKNKDFDVSKTATIQLVLVTDGTFTFTFYIYGNGMMNWVKTSDIPNSSVWIGNSLTYTQTNSYSSTNAYSHPYSFSGQALRMDQAKQNGVSGLVFKPLFKHNTLTDPNWSIECVKWYNANREEEEYINWISTLLPDCPCDIWLSRWDPWFWNIGLQRGRSDVDHVCVDMLPGRTFEPYGKSCCYDLKTWLWVDERSVAGNLYRYNQEHTVEHFTHDIRPKEICCSTPYCHLFYKLRPQGVCYDRTPYHFGTFWGDPHFQTLDGLNFTFNGLGEYTLVRSNANNATFELQARLARATDVNGTLIDATKFSAFAAKENGNTSFFVELNRARTGLNVFSNKVDISKEYNDASKQAQPFVHISNDSSLIIARRGTALSVFFPSSGISFNVTVGAEMLTLTLVLPVLFRNQTSGLLGNYNGNPDDDFTLPNGTIMDSTMSEKEIFHYGEHWSIKSEDSAFVYEDGKDHEDYHNSSFVPKFLDDVDPAKKDAAALACNGPQNVECVLDLVFTGREDVAKETLNVKENADNTKRHMDESLPTLEGCQSVNVTVKQEVLCPVVVSENAEVYFIANNVNASYDTEQKTVKYFQDNDNPADIRVVAANGKNRSSTVFVLEGLLCSGCNGRGNCTYVIREDNRETQYFKYSTCNCEPQYTGDDCEDDFDACEETPCSHDRNCTSLTALQQLDQNRTFICGPCPDGFLGSGYSNEICTDIDECELSTPCQHECFNTEGSYECICNGGYRTHSGDIHLCRDINECEEYAHNCTQACNNYDGSFNCSCFNGFFLNFTTDSCEYEPTTEETCSQRGLECTHTAGCMVDETGNPTCFCDPGYELDGSQSCKDINECESNVCSQICNNTDGSFTCSCLSGYQLVEQRECKECDASHWGGNCENECVCTGQGAELCDSVKGCVCSDGWLGDTCDVNVDECMVDVNVCNDHRKECVDTPGSYDCICISGYTESADGHCQDVDECLSPLDHDCGHICVNTDGSYSCQCKNGYKIKDRNSCIDIDECNIGQHNCEQRCENNNGSYNCYCYVGYTLDDDRITCTKLKDPCLDVNNLSCQHFCHFGASNIECRCQDGYILGSDGQTCHDIDECADGISMCSEGASCRNIDGSYICECQDGSKVDNDGRTCLECDDHHYGKDCERNCSCLKGVCDNISGCVCEDGWFGDNCDVDYNECNQTECMGAHSVCINTPGSFECNCDVGYYNNSGICTDIDECDNEQTNLCDQLCTNTFGSYTCQCHSGFMFDGNQCTDINECDGHNNCDQLCENTLGSYVCYCEEYYKLNMTTRQHCIPISDCDATQKQACGNNASCYVESGIANCKCNRGYHNNSGSCQDINECDLGVCAQNCTNSDGNFECFCMDGYNLAADGILCSVCQSMTYGPECSLECSCNVTHTESCDPINGSCICESGWDGEVCNMDVDECTDEMTCPLNSQCENTVGGYDCVCYVGFYLTDSKSCNKCDAGKYGLDCEQACACNISNTENCNNVNGTCLCKDSWQGITCEVDVDECLNADICTANSNCQNLQGDYVCVCNEGFWETDSGTCEVCSEWTFGINCESNCSCVETNTESCDHMTGMCVCDVGWHGTDCGTDIDECENSTACPSENSNCTNIEGGFECGCEIGYYGMDDVCNVCTDWTFGVACASNCSCTVGTTKSCDHITGECLCSVGWNDTICGTDIDECEYSTTCPSENSNCTNTEGGFVCGCKIGYYLTDDDACTVCTNWTFGVECASNCSCVETNTESCDHMTGLCTCKVGWNGTDCDTDIDECENSTACPSEHSNCTNTEGGFVCGCEIGYYGMDDVCNVCIDWTFGVACESNCSCSVGTTKSCDHITGECLCSVGWNDTICGTDIDECEYSTTCPSENSNCTNTEGGFVCGCKIGYYLTDDDACTVCTNWTFGVECASNCSCVETNTESCDHMTGLCMCEVGWSDTDCGTDINECNNAAACPSEHSNCTNTEGGFVCGCKLGYYGTDDDVCKECSEWLFGVECGSSCSCNQSHTASCDHVTGFCICNVGWNGTNCEMDINECGNETTCPNEHSYCNNTDGGFECNCEGGYFKYKDNSCNVCSEWTFGMNCESNCSCVETNTESCDHMTGMCMCKVGWNGTDCVTDINECDNSTACPNENSKCTNTEGGFVCGCEIGYYGTDDDVCNVCTDWTFGVECASNCSCTVETTKSCDPISGECLCSVGWNDTICGTDIDECENSAACPRDNSNCTNTQGGFVCGCEIGYYGMDDDACHVCTNWTFGVECASNCSCVKTNTESCDHMTGLCMCEVGWNGTDCGIDIDECENSTVCPSEHSNCTNTEGGFVCGCEIGYILKDDNSCTVCTNWTFGVECASNCSCVETNAELCDHMTGICVCMVGWNGTDCGTDINECDNSTACPNEHSKCTNTEGEFVCGCEMGYYGTDGDVCNECSEWIFGVECGSSCSCNQSNSASCDHVTGVCICKDGWNGTNCEMDINECDNETTCPNEHSYCNNTDGGFECNCEGGYFKYKDNSCNECPEWKYGLGCNFNCSCLENNTQSCNHETGFCNCKYGWEGIVCGDDINECNNSTACPNGHFNCTNTIGGYVCDCNAGYFRTDLSTCDVCPNWNFGFGCALSCSCVQSNTQSCDHLTGLCLCKDGWNGPECENDIDECENTTSCPAMHSICVNTEGGFRCECNDEYQMNQNGICKAMKVIVKHSITIHYILPPATDLTDTLTLQHLKENAIVALTAFYAKSTSVALSFHIFDIRSGSLIVNYSVGYDVRDSNVESGIIKAIQDLNEGSIMEFDGENYNVTSDSVTSNEPCELYKTLIGECESGYRCVVEDEAGICRKEKSDYDYGVIIGVTVGTASVIIIAIIVCVVVYLRKRTERQKMNESNMTTGVNELLRNKGDGQLTSQSMFTRWTPYPEAHTQYKIPRPNIERTAYDNELYIQ